MGDWFRSATVLVMAFVAAVAVTIGLANVIVPGGPAGPRTAGPSEDASGSPAASLEPIVGIGGHLAVTGDRQGTLTVTREENGARYALAGDSARIVFQDVPAVVAQLSWEGLEFFPEPEDCTLTPGELDNETGIGHAELECVGISDVRNGETIDLSGTIGMALTMVGESDLPPMGGSVAVGDETWEFDQAFLSQFPINSGPGTEDFNMILTDQGGIGSIRFRYDVQTHRLTLVGVERGGDASEVAPGACSLGESELGRLTPSAAVVELTIDCPVAEVPGLGPTRISGTVIVQQIEF